jgi:hypothetical protein
MRPEDIADAWLSVTDEWFARRNKAHDTQQWEIVHTWHINNLISEDTMKVVGRREHHEAAVAEASRLEYLARAKAVLALIEGSSRGEQQCTRS